MSKPVPLHIWATRIRGDYPPSRKTLYRWIAAGKIFPRPEKKGRDWFVSELAIYVDPDDPDFPEKAARALNESASQ